MEPTKLKLFISITEHSVGGISFNLGRIATVNKTINDVINDDEVTHRNKKITEETIHIKQSLNFLAI